jgi:hypothetical protein
MSSPMAVSSGDADSYSINNNTGGNNGSRRGSWVLSNLEQLLSRGRVELVALIRCSSWGLFHGKLLYAVSLYLAGSDGSMRKTEDRKLIT